MPGRAKKITTRRPAIPVIRDDSLRQFHVKVSYKDHSTLLLVDTASRYSSLTPEFIKLCGLEDQIEARSDISVDYKNMNTTVVGTIEMTMNFGDGVMPNNQGIKFTYIVHDLHPFLGRDFFESYHCKLDLGPCPSLSLGSREPNHNHIFGRHNYTGFSHNGQKYITLLDTGCTDNYVTLKKAKEAFKLTLGTRMVRVNGTVSPDAFRSNDKIEIKIGGRKLEVGQFVTGSHSFILGYPSL